MGISGALLKWVGKYLVNRQQKTIANGITSTNASIEYSVPQGSISGPLFFISYINDAVSTVKGSTIQFTQMTRLFMLRLRPILMRRTSCSPI